MSKWAWFEKRTVGRQLVEALDSVDANLCEAEGRWHDREKLRFFYIARGSLHESRRWLKKAVRRKLLDQGQGGDFLDRAEHIHKRLNKVITYRRKFLKDSS